MQASYIVLIAIGGILLLGLAADYIGRRTFLPRVTTILCFGALVGPQALDLVPSLLLDSFDLIAQVVLTMVGFLLGERLSIVELRKTGAATLVISISAAVITCVTVLLGLYAAGTTLVVAVLLGCIASATAPAATMDVVVEAGAQSEFGRRLLAIVALDDAWALLLFSFGLAVVMATSSSHAIDSPIVFALVEISGAILLGVAIGLPASFLTGRITPGQPMLTEALGLVFLSGGLAHWLGVSYLITAITVGVIITNFARHHEQPFRAIEGLEWPLLATFFVLAGASLDFGALYSIGAIGAVYVICRVLGKITGAWLGAFTSGVDPDQRGWVGAAMLPQAGAAMGMALVASAQFPQYRPILLPVVVGSTVLFELIGPVITRRALDRFQPPE